MRVAFTLFGGRNWTGGYNYLRNLFEVLARFERGRVSPVLFAGEDCEPGDLRPFAAIDGVEVVRSPHLNAAQQRKALMRSVLLGRDPSLHALFRRHRIDLVFEAAQFFGWRLGIPALAWMTDFQHRALPQLFSRAAWWKREFGFRAQVLAGRTIMLSSEDARRACERYYPSTRGRTQTVHFAVVPGAPADVAAARRVADAYGLPTHFFYMPNQYWRHKNHLLVVEASAILRDRGTPVVVASSGSPNDPRDPEHYPRLQARVRELGLTNEFRFLGLVPYEHLASLLRACSALVNPSLFEGWSTTVEEARAMGTPLILSDLDVHREQAGDQAVFFDRRSALALADALSAFQPMDEATRAARCDAARDDAARRTREFADAFVSLAARCSANPAGT